MAYYKHLEFPTDFGKYVMNKKESAKAYYRYLLARVSRMFQYKGLPDSIPHEILDRYLMNNGIACITKVNGKLYCFYGNAGGPQDEYYRPTQFIVSNPHIQMPEGKGFSANIHIFGESPDSSDYEGVLIRNDTEWQGLYPMLARYAFLLAENTLTIRTADVLLRITALLSAPTDKEKAAADEFIANLEDGKLSTIGENPFFDGVRMQSPPSNNGSYLTQFIELQQYLKGSLYNELGLSANYNMKREAIGKGESTLDEDALLPLCDDMLLARREDLKKVNDLFGTDISVEFSSSWLINRLQTLSSLKQITTTSTPRVSQLTEQSGAGQSGDESSQVDTEKDQVEPNPSQVEPTRSQVEPTREESVEGDESGESGESGETSSELNDLSQDEQLTQLLEKANDLSEKGEEIVEESAEETADDQGNNSDDKRDI